MRAAKHPDSTLLKQVACPNCWRTFHPAEVQFVAESHDLRGDPVLGPTEQLRFRAMRFDPAGNALDPHEGRCHRIACPACHLEMPRATLEVTQLPISVVGSPGSGKTNLLAAATWRLRREGGRYGLEFLDAEPGFNEPLHRAESRLFAQADPDADVTLAKTDVGGAELYHTVRVGGQREMLPRPGFFRLRRTDGDGQSMVVLYDNAGEHFLPGADATERPATRHLERSAAVVIVFDPLQDLRFRGRHAPVDTAASDSHERQELILGEAIARMRRLRLLDPSAPVSVPLVIALTKADAWGNAVLGPGWGTIADAATPAAARYASAVWLREADARCRAAITEASPEFVNALDALSRQVRFVPCSALGCSPAVRPDGRRVIAAGRIRPQLPEMPLLVAAALARPGLLPEIAG